MCSNHVKIKHFLLILTFLAVFSEFGRFWSQLMWLLCQCWVWVQKLSDRIFRFLSSCKMFIPSFLLWTRRIRFERSFWIGRTHCCSLTFVGSLSSSVWSFCIALKMTPTWAWTNAFVWWTFKTFFLLFARTITVFEIFDFNWTF